MIGNACFYLSTADIGDQYFITYGADAAKIYRFPFTSLHKNEILKKPVTLKEKETLRKELDIPYEKVILSIGRYIPVKGFDVLIEALSGIEGSVGMYIIGGRPTEAYLKLKEEYKLDNLHFVGFADKAIIKKYYMASDIYAFNSRGDTWGLVINEAMSFGLPVVSSDQCYAALALIENDVNGYIVQVDCADAFREKFKYLIIHSEICERIQKNNLQKAEKYTFEEMAGKIMAALEVVRIGKSE